MFPVQAATKQPQDNNGPSTLISLLQSKSWDKATLRAQSHPHECSVYHSKSNNSRVPTFLALAPALSLACRLAAPFACTKAILNANIIAVRSGGGLARGTPLHEAISNSRVTLDVISMLIQADEDLQQSKINASDVADSTTSKPTLTQSNENGGFEKHSRSNIYRKNKNDQRAVLTQDVDGQVPLHLLVRRYFCFHRQDETNEMIHTLQQLIRSCPEACALTDRRDFEETPLVLALKANMYAHYDTDVADHSQSSSLMSSSPGYMSSLLEEKIHIITNLMLKIYPTSASNSAPNLDYTPLHSAVYHGRCKEIIQNLLHADESTTLSANEGRMETPLHFAAMRGESEAVISTLVSLDNTDNEHGNTNKDNTDKSGFKPMKGLGRKAVSMLDNRGLTPLHWLWVRLIKEADWICSLASTSKYDNQKWNADTLKNWQRRNQLDKMLHQTNVSKLTETKLFFDKTYFHIMSELDPPLDFRQMRHLPTEYATIDPACANAVITILKQLIFKYTSGLEHGNFKNRSLIEDLQQYEKKEAKILLFWKKVECLLKAACQAKLGYRTESYNKQQKLCEPTSIMNTGFLLVHAAAALTCCPPSILYIALCLRADQLSITDQNGNLPLHHAAMRPVHCWELYSSHHSDLSRTPQQLSYQDLASLNADAEDDHGGTGNRDINAYEEMQRNATFVTFQYGESTILEESSLHLVLSHSSPRASRTYNNDNRLPLHLAIDNILNSYASVTIPQDIVSSSTSSYSSSFSTPSPLEYYWRKQLSTPLSFLTLLLKSYPEALEKQDGDTKLYPFMQASAKATSIVQMMSNGAAKEHVNTKNHLISSSSTSPSALFSSMMLPKRKQLHQTESKFLLFSLNVTFCLLRENPMLVKIGISPKRRKNRLSTESLSGEGVIKKRAKINRTC